MKRLLLLSGKGGTGKTTVSSAIMKLSQARAVADCDVDAPNLHLVLPQTAEPQVFAFMGGEKAAVDPARWLRQVRGALPLRRHPGPRGPGRRQ